MRPIAKGLEPLARVSFTDAALRSLGGLHKAAGAAFPTWLYAQPSYRLGDPILIEFDMENISSETYQLLPWGTPLEDELTADCFMVSSGGQIIPYDGKHVSRGNPSVDSYLLINPGETLKFTLDISTWYAIDQVGDYTVTVNTSVPDGFTVAAGIHKQPPHKWEEFQPLTLASSTVKFKVVAGTQPRLTSGQMARAAWALKMAAGGGAGGGQGGMSFDGGTDQEHTDIGYAHGNARYYADLCRGQLSTVPASTNTLYGTWFGSFDQARYNKVKTNYTDIGYLLADEQVSYDFYDDPGSDVIAYSYKPTLFSSCREVWLNIDLWDPLPQLGSYAKFAVLIHEWSHALCGTDDNAYQEGACKSLAANSPDSAANNADSYRLFAEYLSESNYGQRFWGEPALSTLFKCDVDAMIAKGGSPTIPLAVRWHADGYWPGQLGIKPTDLGTSPSVQPNLTITPSVPGMSVRVYDLESSVSQSSLWDGPQTFSWTVEIVFQNTNGFPSSSAASSTVTIAATLTLAGLSSSVQIKLKATTPPPPQLSSFVAPDAVSAGASAGAFVCLDRVAPAGGSFVALSSGNPAVATVPGTVQVGAGLQSATFHIQAKSTVNKACWVTITACLGKAISQQMQVLPAGTGMVQP